jgi:hypothetical protein
MFPDGSTWTEHLFLGRKAFITCKPIRPYQRLEEPLIWPAATKHRCVQDLSTRVDGLIDNVQAGALGDCVVSFPADSQSRHPPNALLLMRAGLQQTSMLPAETHQYAYGRYGMYDLTALEESAMRSQPSVRLCAACTEASCIIITA